MAEVIAASLRDGILRGEIDVLPRLEDLAEEFGAGPPAVREAMRILETEGLVTVRRGNMGGARVHLPTSDRVAYMISLFLQSRSTQLADVGAALRRLEPLCASMCAARPDRVTTVVPELRRLVDEQAGAIGDGVRTREIIARFHRTMVAGCGNETMALMVGALELVWAGQASAVFSREEFEEPEMARWQASVRDHERLVAAIAAGDAGVVALAERHLEATHAYISAVDDDRDVSAAAMSAVTG
jgi:DNA-binding FadR family transcriptional regulator